MKKKLDFLPNKLNKYSIRRFTVGTASILVGSTLLFGIGNEAHAAEEHQKSNTTENVADSNASEAPTKEETPSNEATSEALSKEHSSDNSISNPEVNSEIINKSKQETDNDKSSTSNEDNYVTYAAPTTSTNTRSVDSPSGVSSDNSQAQKQGKMLMIQLMSIH